MLHKGTQTIKTARLTLRRVVIEDAEQMYANWANDSRVTRFLSWKPHGSVEETKEILSRWIPEYENQHYYNWVIEYENEAIGNISIVRIHGENAVEIGYAMGYAYWNKGIMTEAATAVIEYMITYVNAETVIISHADKNPASGRVAQKCGLKYYGTTEKGYKNSSGEYFDVLHYRINSEEWSQL